MSLTMMKVNLAGGRHTAVPTASRQGRSRLTNPRQVTSRSKPSEDGSAPSSSSPMTPAPAEVAVAKPVLSGEYQGPVGSLNVLGTMQEAINGRAAMLGFVAAVISEAATHQGVLSQIAGRYTNGDLVEAPLGTSTLLFGAVVGLTTLATLVPKLVEGLEVDSRSFGPFTPRLEKVVGRVAQLGFAGLLVVELVKGSALLG